MNTNFTDINYIKNLNKYIAYKTLFEYTLVIL